ncbi:MAG: hypothetical protein ABIH46_06700, partial [Chloroflexota bacterium]
WSLAVVLAVYVVTGYGIAEYRTVEALTFGWLTKTLAFQVHTNLWVVLAFLALMGWHIYRRAIFKGKLRSPWSGRNKQADS